MSVQRPILTTQLGVESRTNCEIFGVQGETLNVVGFKSVIESLRWKLVDFRKLEAKSSDFDWFISADLSEYQGKHIAIFNKEVIGWGNTSLEAYRMAKEKKPNSKPALTYVDKSADTIF